MENAVTWKIFEKLKKETMKKSLSPPQHWAKGLLRDLSISWKYFWSLWKPMEHWDSIVQWTQNTALTDNSVPTGHAQCECSPHTQSQLFSLSCHSQADAKCLIFWLENNDLWNNRARHLLPALCLCTFVWEWVCVCVFIEEPTRGC